MSQDAPIPGALCLWDDDLEVTVRVRALYHGIYDAADSRHITDQEADTLSRWLRHLMDMDEVQGYALILASKGIYPTTTGNDPVQLAQRLQRIAPFPSTC